MGNVHFLHAVMRNGIFQIRDQQDLVSAILQTYSSVDEHHADSCGNQNDRAYSSHRDTLRAEAVHARQQVKKARKLVDASNSGAALTLSEKKLCVQFETGELEEVRKQKDRAYGYGESVTSFSVEQAAVLRAFSFNQLEAYFE